MGQNLTRNQFRDCQLLNLFNSFYYQNDYTNLVTHYLKFISKLLKKHEVGENSHKKARNTKIIRSIQ